MGEKHKFKIFILNPLIYSRKKSIMNVRPRQPLSLAYIANLLRNHEIKFLDANVLKYSIEKTLKEIRKFNPDYLILTSSPVDRWECPNSNIDSIFEIINKANIKTVLTGSHGSLTPDWIFKKCKVDIIVRGESELTVLDVVNGKNPKGISYRKNNKIIHNLDANRIQDLDALFPAYDLLPMDKYSYSFFDLPKPFSIMLTSRGCPFKCIFCSKAMAKDQYIVRSFENVIKEIKHLVDNFKIRSIFFQDWEFTIDKKRVENICDSILKEKIKILWGCNARANDLSDKLVRKMKKSGCVRINIGFESGSQEILNKINKRINIKDLEMAIKICKENNINIGMYSMINLPGENKKTIKETVEFLKRNNINSMTPNFVIPYFGTDLFSRLKKNKQNINFTWDNIENYAGKVDTKLKPWLARFYYRNFKFEKQYGKLYFINPKFYYEKFFNNN